MKHIKKYPPQETLKNLFYYNNGFLFWKNDQGSNKVKNKNVGWDSVKGYRQVSISNQTYLAHRLIWIFHFGDIPKGLQIDHINQNKKDNRIENLRLVTNGENMWNTQSSKGCYFNRRNKKWTTQIGVNNRRLHIGDFDTELEAQRIYKIVKRILSIVVRDNT